MIRQVTTEEIMQLAGQEWESLRRAGRIPHSLNVAGYSKTVVNPFTSSSIYSDTTELSAVAHALVAACVRRFNEAMNQVAGHLDHVDPEILEAASIALAQEYIRRTKPGSGG